MTSPAFRIRSGRTAAALVAALLAFAPAALAQAPKPSTAAAPKLVLVEEKKDVGTVPKGRSSTPPSSSRTRGRPTSTSPT